MQPFVVCRDGETIWAWLGTRRGIDADRLQREIGRAWPETAVLVTGEPTQGLSGWRLTHRQARATLPIALCSSQRGFVRYADIALLASILQDALVGSLREIYLAPLPEERDGGDALRKILRAYFVANRNISSTAAALGVSRRTVANRLATVERRIGRPLSGILSELEWALRLDDLDCQAEDA